MELTVSFPGGIGQNASRGFRTLQVRRTTACNPPERVREVKQQTKISIGWCIKVQSWMAWIEMERSLEAVQWRMAMMYVVSL